MIFFSQLALNLKLNNIRKDRCNAVLDDVGYHDVATGALLFDADLFTATLFDADMSQCRSASTQTRFCHKL